MEGLLRYGISIALTGYLILKVVREVRYLQQFYFICRKITQTAHAYNSYALGSRIERSQRQTVTTFVENENCFLNKDVRLYVLYILRISILDIGNGRLQMLVDLLLLYTV